MGESIGLETELETLIALVGSMPAGDLTNGSGPVGSAAPGIVSDSGIVLAMAPVAPGSTWPRTKGAARWRLSAATGSLASLTDRVNLADLVGKQAAEATVKAFLAIRPGGGRVFVDERGDAVTPVENRLVYLGRMGVASANAASTDGSLRAAVIAALREAPGSTAREIAYELGRRGRSAGKTEVNSLMYGDRTSFVSDGATVPRWRVATTAAVAREAAAPSASGLPAAPVKAVRTGDGRDVYRDLVGVAEAPERKVTHVGASEGPRPVPDLLLGLMAWQREAIRAWYDNGCHGIVEAVTGTGKTHLGLEAVAQAVRGGERSTVLVPSVDLQDQWAARFQTFLPHLRVARLGGHSSGDPQTADVTIAVVNSALRHDLSALSPDSLLVADEVHRYGSEQFQYALRANYRRRLGLTATLERSGDDAVEAVLAPYVGGSIMQVTFDRAIREGVVAPFRLVMAPVSLSDDEQAEYDGLSRQISNGMKVLRGSGALKGAGSSISMELGRLRGAGGEIGKAARMAETAMRKRRQLLAAVSGKLDAIEELSEMIGQSQGTVIFTQSKEVAENAALVLREWGVPASALHSDMNDKERRGSLDDLSTGALQALAAPKLLDEGIDVPTVDLGVVMTASRSRRQMVQRLGRVIRRKDDGRPVDFVILYAHDTVEDPSSGVHEGFFDLVGEVASRKLTLEPGWTANDLAV
ncbi:DEAD/DEAH box helicase [Nocardioides pacificus]